MAEYLVQSGNDYQSITDQCLLRADTLDGRRVDQSDALVGRHQSFLSFGPTGGMDPEAIQYDLRLNFSEYTAKEHLSHHRGKNMRPNQAKSRQQTGMLPCKCDGSLHELN